MLGIFTTIVTFFIILCFSWGTFKGNAFLDLECLKGLFLQIPEAVRYWQECEGQSETVVSALEELNKEALGENMYTFF